MTHSYPYGDYASGVPDYPYRSLIFDEAGEYGIDPNEAIRQVFAESSGDPYSIGELGERGLMQLLPSTAAEEAQRQGIFSPNLFDPETNLKLGLGYARKQQDEFGPLGPIGYNWGEGNLRGALAQAATTREPISSFIPPGPETYASKIKGEDVFSMLPKGEDKNIQTLETTSALGGFGGGAGGGEEEEGLTPRGKRIRDLSEEMKSYQEEKERLEESLKSPAPLTAGESFGMIGIPALGVLLGAALAGKRGALAGTQAGLAGLEVAQKGVAERERQVREIGKERFQDLTRLQQESRGEIRRQEEAQLDFGERSVREDRYLSNPLVKTAIAKIRSGKEDTVTQEEQEALASSSLEEQRLVDIARKERGVEGRFGKAQDLRERQNQMRIEQGIPAPYRAVSPGAKKLRPEDAAEYSSRYAGVQSMIRSIEDMAQTGRFAFTREDAILAGALSGIITNQFREATKSGANFTGTEQGFIKKSIMPKLAAGRTWESILATLTGRDQEMYLRIIPKALNAGIDAELIALGYTRPGGEYNERQWKELDRDYGGASPIAGTPLVGKEEKKAKILAEIKARRGK